MAVTFVQSAQNSTTSTGGTLTLTFPANVTAGNFVAVTFCGRSCNVTAASVTGNSMTAVTNTPYAFTGGYMTGIYWATNVTGGSATVTLTISATLGQLDAVAMEFSGIATSSVTDQTARNTGASTSPSSGNMATTNANDLLIGCIGMTVTSTITAGTGWTGMVSQTTALDGVGMEYQIVSSTGTYAATATLGTSQTWGTVIAGFKATSVSPPVSTGLTLLMMGV